MGKKSKDFLLEAIANLFITLPKGKVLDLGCGDGDYARRLKDLGFDVIAGDIDIVRFKYKNEIEFKHCDITKEIPFSANHFDYVLLKEKNSWRYNDNKKCEYNPSDLKAWKFLNLN